MTNWRDISKKFDEWVKKHGLIESNASPKMVWKMGAYEAKSFFRSTLDEYVKELLRKDIGIILHPDNTVTISVENRIKDELLALHEENMADDYTSEERNGNIYMHRKEGE